VDPVRLRDVEPGTWSCTGACVTTRSCWPIDPAGGVEDPRTAPTPSWRHSN